MSAELETLFSDCRAGRVDAVLAQMDRVGGMGARSPEGWTPLIVASYHGHLELARALIERGADVNAVNRKGTSVLMFAKSAALRDGNFAVMDLLLAAGADVFHRDRFGRDIEDYARELQSPALVRFIVEVKAKANTQS
ncbi:MAG TPA: ankyrin repeat domain-containing protein [Opitutaceae bacterium]|nr:ankyrin repeat domain-containing protein [Opitutaceae bacterium]